MPLAPSRINNAALHERPRGGPRERGARPKSLTAASIVILLSVACLPGPRCYAQDANQSGLLIHVRVNKGKLAVDREKSLKDPDVFKPSDLFSARITKRLPREKILKILFNYLDEAFAQMDSVYRYALKGEEQSKEPVDNLTKELGAFTGGGDSWESYKKKFDEWVKDGQNQNKPRSELNEIFNRTEMFRPANFESLVNQTALVFKFTGRPNPVNFEKGTLRFNVADPVDNPEEIAIEFLGMSAQPSPEASAEVKDKTERIKSVLGSLKGRLWRSRDVKLRIEDYYSVRGLQAQIKVSPPAASKRIQISESPRLGQILFPGDTPADAIDKAAYLLLPNREFQAFINGASGKRPLTDIVLEIKKEDGTVEKQVLFKATDYNRLGRPQGEEPYLNQFQFQMQQLQLSQIGYLANQSPREENNIRYVDLQLVKTESSDKAQGKTPISTTEPSTPAANEQGVAQSGIAKPLRQTSFVASVPARPARDSSATGLTADTSAGAAASEIEDTLDSWKPKEKKHYAGFGFEYRPGQNVRYFGIYQYSLPNQQSVSIKFGSQGEHLESFNYSADYVLFGALRRKLSIQLTGSSDFQANRLFAGTETDERRRGGLARAELELFRDLNGAMLRVSLEGSRNTVTLSRGESEVKKQNLTTLDIGALFFFERSESYLPKRLRVEPRLRLGLGAARGEERFTRFQISSNYHQQLSSSLEADITGNLSLASRATPVFELPSFGGEEMVRGFRRDDALGRKVWSLQSELWLPIPGVSRSSEGIASFLRRQVRLAGFADVGGAYQTVDSRSGARFGPGLGARLVFNPIVLKLDWAYGIGDAALGRGRGKFYFSVTTNLPF
ncbi:MAG: hypothetical protein AB7U82_10815 [Blastocatellales bacterium]